MLSCGCAAQGAVKEGRGKREEESHDDLHVFIVGTTLDEVTDGALPRRRVVGALLVSDTGVELLLQSCRLCWPHQVNKCTALMTELLKPMDENHEYKRRQLMELAVINGMCACACVYLCTCLMCRVIGICCR